MKIVYICVETTKQAATDNKYIDKALKYYYDVGTEESIKYHYMGGKGNCTDTDITKEVRKLRTLETCDEVDVVVCIDLDSASDPDNVQENKKIFEYCKAQNFRVVWFCSTIEEVFLHSKMSDSQKKSASVKFYADKKDGLGKATTASLSSETQNTYKSNFLNVFDAVLVRKRN